MTRFGIGVTTNNPGVGVFCPAVSENGVVAAQYQTYGKIGPAILSALDDGIPATDAVPAALDSSERASYWWL